MEKTTKKDSKIVFNYGIVRKLLSAGCVICDIKPDKENAVTGKDKCVFVFKADEHFWTEFEKINKEVTEAKSAHEVQ